MQGSVPLPGILSRIVATKREEILRLRERRVEVERKAASAPPPLDFPGALARPGTVSLIAECKRRSPGAGEIRPDLDPGELVAGYAAAGAAALSVLTDEVYFGGREEDLGEARERAGLPVLRKDFVLDPLQVLEARGMGADAVLLIVRLLSDAELRALAALAEDLGMAVLVETHDGGEVARAVDVGARIIGINNRDLATFTTDLETTARLLEGVPRDAVVVSESGIRTRADVEALGAAGVDAILVGETLLRAEDPAAAAAELAGVASRLRGSGGAART